MSNSPPSGNPNVSQHLFTAIRESTAGVFSTLLNIEISPCEFSEQADPPPLNGVMALIGLTGEWVGTGMLYCQEKLACQVSSNMLATEITDITPDVLDGVGELANMVIGNLKDLLEPVAGVLAMSIPTVVYGRNFQARPTQHRNWIVAPFTAGGEEFQIRLCLAPRSTPRPAFSGTAAARVRS